MPIAPFEKAVLGLLAANRNPESFVAGATILLREENSHRRSRDIDLFHDAAESVKAAAEADGALLERNGYQVSWDVVGSAFRRALVAREGGRTKLEWVFDSAFRFFPVEPDAEWGYALNFWDAATNKILALAGRGELRDYLDVLQLHGRHLSLGALAWAACGKDIGFTPQFLLEEAQRLAYYCAPRGRSRPGPTRLRCRQSPWPCRHAGLARGTRFLSGQGLRFPLSRQSSTHVQVGLPLVAAKVQHLEGVEVFLGCLLLALHADQSLTRGVNTELAQVGCNPFASQLLSDGCRRARATKEVGDQVAFIGRSQKNPFEQSLRFLRRIA